MIWELATLGYVRLCYFVLYWVKCVKMNIFKSPSILNNSDAHCHREANVMFCTDTLKLVLLQQLFIHT